MAAKTHSTPEIPMGKHVAWNRENKDFDFFYDRQYLGSRQHESEARECVNEYAYDLARGHIATVAADADPIPFPETVVVNVAPVDEYHELMNLVVCDTNDVDEADVALICAAPDLLAACEAAERWFDKLMLSAGERALVAQLRAAIHKATND